MRFAQLSCAPGWVTSLTALVALAGCQMPPPAAEVPDTVPDFAAAAFNDPASIDNPYLPFAVGSTWTYEGDTQDGHERVVVEVLDETRMVMGIACRVVRDRVYLDDDLVEDTRDWYAQDDAGNVWYMGEDVDNYNYDETGQLVDITHEGAWEAGEDVAGAGEQARPGFAMKAAPQVGDIYHQEYYPGEAEDMGEVVAVEVAVTLGDGAEHVCLQTRDFTPLDSSVNEHKFYAPGVGLVLEEPVDGGERLELVEVSP